MTCRWKSSRTPANVSKAGAHGRPTLFLNLLIKNTVAERLTQLDPEAYYDFADLFGPVRRAGYTLHQPPEPASDAAMPSLDDQYKPAAAMIEHEMIEYLRLQPHERDNFSILLYNCDSPDLPRAVVDTINRINAKREDNKITCQVLLMHRDEVHLRQIYRDLVARGVDAEADPTEGSGDFLAKVRVNITAANRLRREGRSQPVDIAYCRDLVSREAKPAWEWLPRETAEAVDLQPHQ